MDRFASMLSIAAVSFAVAACATDTEEPSSANGKADGPGATTGPTTDSASPLTGYPGLQTINQLLGYRVECKDENTVEMQVLEALRDGTYTARMRFQPGNSGRYEFLEDVAVTVSGDKLTFSGTNASGTSRTRTITRGKLEAGCTEKGGWQLLQTGRLGLSGGDAVECKSADGKIDVMLRLSDRPIRSDLLASEYTAYDSNYTNGGGSSTGEIRWGGGSPDTVFIGSAYRITFLGNAIDNAEYMPKTVNAVGTKLTCLALEHY